MRASHESHLHEELVIMKPIMTHGLVFCLLIMLVACGGSSTPPTPPPNPNNAGFSNASLNGTYVYRVSGSTASSNAFAAVGVFVADGSGHITSGQQDKNDSVTGINGGGSTPTLTGTYSVGVDGRGQATFNYSNGSSNTFEFVLSSTSKGRLIGFTSLQVATGVIEKQASPTPTTLGGTYVLRLDGSANNGATAWSRMGQLTASGGSGTASAVLDENLAGTFTATIPTSSGSFNFSGSAGRGTMTLATASGGLGGTGGTFQFVFYVVDSTRVEVLSIDAASQLAGYANAQSGSFSTANVAGTYVFGISGLSNAGSIAEVGQFTLDGTGLVSTGLEDAAENGAYTPSLSFSSGSYTLDASHAGRFTATVNESISGTTRTLNLVMWFSTAGNAFMMTTTSSTNNTAVPLLETGLVQVQPATPSNSTLNGPGACGSTEGCYALNLSGATFSGGLAMTGQLAASGSGTFTGLEDFNLGGTPVSGSSASGGYSFASNGRGTGTIGGTPVVLYPADGNTVYLMSTDGSVLAGSLEQQ
jgi:hypothetical protein